MSTSDVEPTPRRAGTDQIDRSTARQLAIIWMLLFVNVLGFDVKSMLIPVPRSVGQGVTMGCLAVAFFLALRLNPMVRVRFNPYLVLLSILVALAFVSSAPLQGGLGSLFRCFRLAAFVATLWMISPWWRGDLRFARLHLSAVSVVLGSAVLGFLVAPGMALSGGTPGDNRLQGVLWPIPPTQLGAYGAIAAGLAVVLWLTRALNGRRTLAIVSVSIMAILLSQTRTAMAGLAIGLTLAAVTLIFTNSRARRAIGVGGSAFLVVVLAAPEPFIDWLQRDQSAAEISNLTGRQKVWDALLARERTPIEGLVGNGLGGKTFDGHPIDSSWMSTYNELGMVGVAIIAAMLLSLLVMVARRPPSPARRCALFLILYCCVASYTESGLSDASPYLLHLAAAASLLQRPPSTADTVDADDHEHQDSDR